MLRKRDLDVQHAGKLRLLQRPNAAIATGLITAAAYFLGARLGLVLLTELEGVAVFWPASGVAAGILIALGPHARMPVAIGVVVATVAANLLGDRNLWASIFSGLCNAGEAMLTAWLIARWFGPPFRLDGLDRVLGFLLAASIGAGTAAIGGAITMRLFHTTAPVLSIWRVWFASDGLGIVMIAPVLIGLARIVEARPRRELIEGCVSLVALAVVSAVILSLPPGLWATVLPAAMLFPLLLWLAARCAPVYAAAAAFIIGFAIVWVTSFGIGFFGDTSVPIQERILGAQISMLAAALCALALAALFEQMRRHEAALQNSNERLQLALNGAELGVFSADIATGRFRGDERVGRQHGHMEPPETLRQVRQFVDPDDLQHIDRAFSAAQRDGGVCSAEYRVVYPRGHPRAGEVRWIAVEGTVVRNAEGRPVRLLGVTRDISKSKVAEDGVRKREKAFRDLLEALPGAVYTTDAAGRVTFFNKAAVDIWGSRPRLGYTQFGGTWPLFYLDGRPMPDEESPLAVALKEDRPIRGIEVIGERPDGSRVHFIPYPTPLHDESGKLVGAVNMLIDITELKRAEERQNLLIAELDHRVKNVLACVSAVAQRSREGSSSIDEFLQVLDGRILSMANTHALLSRSRWLGVHLADLVRCELAPWAGVGNAIVEGGDIALTADATQSLAMVLHELATNAAKYGALSTPSGHVSVRWERQQQNGNSSAGLIVEWREVNGPSVVAPSRSGYGTSVIADLIPYELGGAVDLAFATDGVRCRIAIPSRWIASADRLGAAPNGSLSNAPPDAGSLAAQAR